MKLSTRRRRLGAWSAGAAATLVITGWQWAAQPVTLPLVALLILTFVPTHEVIQAIRTKLPKPQNNAK